MKIAKLTSYAPQARKDFIVAVTARAHLLGRDDQNGHLKVAPEQTQGGVTLMAGQAWPAKVDGGQSTPAAHRPHAARRL